MVEGTNLDTSSAVMEPCRSLPSFSELSAQRPHKSYHVREIMKCRKYVKRDTSSFCLVRYAIGYAIGYAISYAIRT
jgi:hypothetical protein